jgi:hypothetical protein
VAQGSSAQGFVCNRWGTNRTGPISEDFDPKEQPSLARLMDELELDLIDVGGSEPSQVALGRKLVPEEGEVPFVQVTPFFSSVSALEFFVGKHLNDYLGLTQSRKFPRRWFWQDNGQRSSSSTMSTQITERAVFVP